jgi:hypothetical protein
MQKKIKKVVSFCDECGKEDMYLTKCLFCGVEHCYDCTKTKGKKYAHGVHVGGTLDGYYCNECDSKLTASCKNNLHNAYITISDLRDEEHRFYEDFKKRQDSAEKKIEKLAQ